MTIHIAAMQGKMRLSKQDRIAMDKGQAYLSNVGWNVGEGGTKDRQMAISSQPRMSDSRLGFSVVCRHSCT